MDKNPAAILEAIALHQSGEEPTSVYLLARLPELTGSDWINRWGPIDAWPPILAKFSTSQLAYLAKALTVLERDLNWIGGSVASTIWIFRAYQAREDGDAQALADWILSNGSNSWTRSSVRNLLDPHRERELRQARRLAYLEHEALQRKRKEDKAREAQERASLRQADAKMRAARLKALLAELEAMGFQERLALLAIDATIPLEAVPDNLITPCLPTVQELPEELRGALLARLDCRNAGRWRKLRRALQAQHLN